MASTAKKAPAKTKDETEKSGPFIRSKSKNGFYRGGVKFTREWIDTAKLDLTDEQKGRIEEELSLEGKSRLEVKESLED